MCEHDYCEDIDLHRYKCSSCGKIGYYSEAARKYYMEGIKSNIKGLGDEE